MKLLSEIAWIIKNLRGVLYIREITEERLKFISKRFRYRNLGIPPSIDIEQKRPFIKLIYPSEVIEKFVLDFKSLALESIVLASCYVSPIITFLKDYEDLKPFAIDEVKIERELNEKDLRLHLRIADYTVIDFYSWSTNFAYTCLREANIEEMIRERKRRVKQDKRRYWRIESKDGRTFISYLDLATFVSKRPRIKIDEEIKATLAIITAVVI